MLRWLFFSGLFAPLLLWGQAAPNPYATKTNALVRQVAQARTDSDKVVALGRLAIHYYLYKATPKADSVLNEQLALAEHSDNSNLLLSVLFSYTTNNIDAWNSVNTFNRALDFVEKGRMFARQQGRRDYEALALIRKAAILRNRGRQDAAMEQAVQAGMLLEGQPHDSIRCVLQLETGDIFLAKGNAVAAYQSYNQAWDLAYAHGNKALLTQAYHHIALLYQGLGRSDLAATTLKTSLEQNIREGNTRGMLLDYVDLARVTDKKEYIEKAILYADSLQSDRDRLFAKQLMLAYLMVVERNSRGALQYLYAHPDLHQLQRNRGEAQYRWQIGSIYYYARQPDSAIGYFLQAAPALALQLDPPGKIDMHRSIGKCLLELKRPTEAQWHINQAVQQATLTQTLLANKDLLLLQSQVEAASGHYQLAYQSREAYQRYLDSANSSASGRELALLEVERANSKHQFDLLAQAQKESQRKSLQYAAISIATLALFTFLLLLGLFPGSALKWVRPLGFISFICLFEFIILLIDTELHHATHGAPLPIWLAKIAIIGILLPLHHWLEHKVVHYLASRKLAGMRSRIRPPAWWPGTKKKAGGKPVAATVAAAE